MAEVGRDRFRIATTGGDFMYGGAKVFDEAFARVDATWVDDGADERDAA